MNIADPRTLTALDEVRKAKPEMVFYSSRTCWWATRSEDLVRTSDVPVDPSGAPLFQTEDVEDFLSQAESEPSHYGRRGIEAFILAYHGNVVNDDGRPLCAASWDSYNDLLDAAGKRTGPLTPEGN